MEEQVERDRGNGDWRREGAEGGTPGSATFAEIDEQLRSFVHERPFVAVAAAVAAGFVLGRILSRI